MKVKKSSGAEKQARRMQAEQEEQAKRGDARIKAHQEAIAEALELDGKRKVRKGPMVRTTGEGGTFKVKHGMHYDTDGTCYGPFEEAGAIIETDLPLDELFGSEKFERQHGPTRLFRDARRDGLTDGVRDIPDAFKRKTAEATGEEEPDDEEKEDIRAAIHAKRADREQRVKAKRAERDRLAAAPAEVDEDGTTVEASEDRPRKKKSKKSRD